MTGRILRTLNTFSDSGLAGGELEVWGKYLDTFINLPMVKVNLPNMKNAWKVYPHYCTFQNHTFLENINCSYISLTWSDIEGNFFCNIKSWREKSHIYTCKYKVCFPFHCHVRNIGSIQPDSYLKFSAFYSSRLVWSCSALNQISQLSFMLRSAVTVHKLHSISRLSSLLNIYKANHQIVWLWRQYALLRFSSVMFTLYNNMFVV